MNSPVYKTSEESQWWYKQFSWTWVDIIYQINASYFDLTVEKQMAIYGLKTHQKLAKNIF